MEFPFTHNLMLLVNLLPSELINIPELRAASILTDYATVSRYPGEEEPVVEEEYRDALQLAEAVVAWAEAVIYKER